MWRMMQLVRERPPLTPELSGTELLRWYWLKTELAGLARVLGVSAGGGKVELTERIRRALDGDATPRQSVGIRRTAPARPLAEPLTRQTVLPPGQRCTQQLRAYLSAEIGRGFHFDDPMRDFIGAGTGRTLGEVVEHWWATRDREPPEIAPQFELNRFLSDWHAAHPGGSRRGGLDAWLVHRALPVDARPPMPR